MEIFFQDPSEIPLPPEEVHIRQLRAEARSDHQRVAVFLEVDPFQKRPNAEVTITDEAGQPVAQANVIESMTRIMEFTMHLRQTEPKGQYHVSAVLYYSEPIPEAKEPQEGIEPEPLKLPASTVVDRAEATFTINPA